ncbi:MAG: aldo/keto reductase [Anaerolineaceae bacterium]|nr:aldo/keto reductase [Anaerolineaceae bacterium]
MARGTDRGAPRGEEAGDGDYYRLAPAAGGARAALRRRGKPGRALDVFPTPRAIQKLYALVEDLGIPISELALRFVISNPDISTTLMGARSVVEVEANVKAVEAGPLPADVLARIGEIAALVPFRPFEEPFSMPFGRPERNGPAMAR